MSIPNRPGSRAENLYGNMIGQETATPPTNPQSRIEDYLDYILNNGTQLEQEIKDDVDALKGIGRYLSLWDCTTGKPTTDPKKLPYKYKSGDYYIVSAVGATNYMPSGTQYEGTASSTTDSGVSVNDFYLFDGTTWSRMAHSSVESVFVATYRLGANNAWSCDKTFAEIKAAYDAGKLCFANFGPRLLHVAYLCGVNNIRIEWRSVHIVGQADGSIDRKILYHNNDNTISTEMYPSWVIPSVSSSDNGKVLGVSNGQWNKVDLDVHNIPDGGTTGQVLKKLSDISYDATWADESGSGGDNAIKVFIPSFDDQFNIEYMINSYGILVDFTTAALNILESGDSGSTNYIFKLMVKGNEDTGAFFDSEAYVTALTGRIGSDLSEVIGTITFKIPDTKVSGLNDMFAVLAPSKFPSSMTDLYIKWTREYNSQQEYVESFEYFPVCDEPLRQIDLLTEYPTLDMLLLTLFQEGFTAALTGGGSSDIQVSDASGDTLFPYVDSFLNYIFDNARILEHTLDGIVLDDGNGTRFLMRKINVANGISMHFNAKYEVPSVFEGSVDVVCSVNGVPSSGSISNRSVFMSIKTTQLTAMTHGTMPSLD